MLTKRFFRKVFLIFICYLSLGSFPAFAATESISPASQFTGMWLYLWWHGTVSVRNEDGTATDKVMFVPESYRETGPQKSETFLTFRADGTGTFFRRYVIFKLEGKKNKKVVVFQTTNKEWREEDKLTSQVDFNWRLAGDKLIITTPKKAPKFSLDGQYSYLFNIKPTLPAPMDVQERLGLQDELIIYQCGQFLRLSAKAEEILKERYGIK
ncbi:MAG: hypothetical protein K6U80_09195 [Firmicutes bacterium]|nr:hypothetical protein [Bacillota bacterium]